MAAEDGGVPLSPASLQVLVSGRADADFFLRSGREQSEFIRRLMADNGAELEELDSILDLGCGCGRIARWWQDLDGPELHGCDYNPKLTAWCERHLPLLRVACTPLEPPLPYENGSFDFVYALSVFTHLTEEQQRRWLAELRRVVRPGGRVLLTLNGRFYAHQLSPREREIFDRGRVVTRFDQLSGTNLCATYHPPSYVETQMLDGGFELIDAIRPSEHPERGAYALGQDTYLIGC